MKPPRVVTFGEMLLRLSPPDHEHFLQSPSMSTCFGGAEANVAVSLAHLGSRATCITRLPANLLGDAALKALAAEGVDAGQILRGPERMGLYFVDPGNDVRPMRVVYDRAGSAFAGIEPGMVDWSSAFHGADWFHSTGITPALGAGPAAALAEAISSARAMGVPFSIDLNYREALWQSRDPRPLIEPLVRGADLLIGNPAALKAMLDVEAGDETSSRAIAERFDCKRVAVTNREVLSNASHRWGATLYEASPTAWSPGSARVVDVVDRVGGGDSFTAALIDRLLRRVTGAHALAFAVAASAMKLRVPGDWNRVTATAVEEFICAMQDS